MDNFLRGGQQHRRPNLALESTNTVHGLGLCLFRTDRETRTSMVGIIAVLVWAMWGAPWKVVGANLQAISMMVVRNGQASPQHPREVARRELWLSITESRLILRSLG